MIDLSLLRENPEQIITLLKMKEPSFDARGLYELDVDLRSLRMHVESLRQQRNLLAKKGQQGVTPELRQEATTLHKNLKEAEELLHTKEALFQDLYLACPNVPCADLPLGGKESNRTVKVVGTKPVFSFAIKNHIDLGSQLGWFDFPAAAAMTGSNFPLYKNDAVKLLYALTMFMIDNNQKHGYDLVLPPYLVNEQSLINAGNFPKFKDQVYGIGNDPLFLIPTAEVGLANLYRDHIFSADQLPKRFTSWTSCFRREAGAYGAAERGLIRIHQFEKVELYTYSTPENSEQELDRMVSCAETILQKLGIHYRISLLAGQDCSFQSAKTYDIEVWIPSHDRYYEVSSCSNCTDFQSRRGGMRYRMQQGDKPRLVHTLNGSSLALPRLMVALMEMYQQEDGTIAIPSILRNYGVW
jgi:seryl-tRNA synthetase